MRNDHRITRCRTPLFAATAALALAATIAPRTAPAQVTFDVIGPHEYDLPVGYEPWNVFVQYVTVQDNDKAFDGSGDRFKLDPGSRAITGLSKWVHFFTVDSLPNVGMGFEVIQPEVNLRTDATSTVRANTNSGFGDTMIGYAIWYKPTPGTTLGLQTFLQMPIGSNEVSDTNWKNLTSAFWYVPFGDGRWGWTGDFGFVVQSPRDDGVHPGVTVHTNNRLGFKATGLLEPFVAVDYERTGKGSVRGGGKTPSSHALDLGAGLMFHLHPKHSLALRYSRSTEGENHSSNDSMNIKYVYVF
ncbi:transporter [Dokdonella ginsengisoli]|uniref:Transporter n=1 Tax=Dokdonella ginsengisoli TaxID=363846 RepID=A0ABV9QR40_9GAMM